MQPWSVSNSWLPLNSWQRLGCWPTRKSLTKATIGRQLWSVLSSILASVELLAVDELQAGDELLDDGDDLQAALEHLELPASVELLATLELPADDELLGEDDDLQAALERLELPASVEPDSG